MKHTIKRVGAFAMAAAMSVSLMGGALAYTTPDFTDVPAGNWAYAPVMKMADAGVIKGSSATTFSPEVKISLAMWLTLVGRAVYEADVKAAAQTGDTWFDAYVRVAETKGLLTGTAIDKNAIEGEMTRYDMAVTLYAAIKLLGAKDATVDTAKIKDYGDIPNKYTTAVGQVYAQGLIKGDNAGNFNGTATMTRVEAAAVMDRLITLRDTKPAEPEKPTETIPPRTGVTKTFTVTGRTFRMDEDYREIPLGSVAVTFYYKDGRELANTVSDANGDFTLNVTVDEADYTRSGSVYYCLATGVDVATGTKYQSVQSTQPDNLASRQNDWWIAMYKA